MTTTALDQIHERATKLAERVDQTKTSIDEFYVSPICPPVGVPSLDNLGQANTRFTNVRHAIEHVLAAHGLATMLRRVGGELALTECATLIEKMNDALDYLAREFHLAECQLAVATIAIAKRVSLPGTEVKP